MLHSKYFFRMKHEFIYINLGTDLKRKSNTENFGKKGVKQAIFQSDKPCPKTSTLIDSF